MDTTFIYALNDPETGECRYVGKADDPHDRLFGPQGHLKNCHKKRHCACWIRGLLARGLVPLLEILQEVPKTEWELWERVWIKASRKIGMDLTNATDGGDSGPITRGKDHPCFGKPSAFLGRSHSSDSILKMRKKKEGASSDFHGVCWRKDIGRWQARICFSSRTKYLGYFLDEIEAAEVYDIAAKIHHGAHAVLNFPD